MVDAVVAAVVAVVDIEAAAVAAAVAGVLVVVAADPAILRRASLTPLRQRRESLHILPQLLRRCRLRSRHP